MTRSRPDGDNPTRRILGDVGSDSGFLAFLDVSNADLLFLIPAVVAAMVSLELVVLATGQFFLGVALALLVLAGAGVYVSVCPDHRTPIGLLYSLIDYHRRNRTMRFTDTNPNDSSDTPPDVRDLTNVRAVEPAADAVRRTDETLVGAVRIDPANLALADASEWNRAAGGFGQVLNTLDFPVQIHSSARRVDPERLTGIYDDRRTDPDVRASPALQELVEVYRHRRPQAFRERGTSRRQYHILVPVSMQAVSLADHPWVQRLRRLPAVGDRLASPLADGLLYDDRRERIEKRQRAILADRRDHLVNQLMSLEGVEVTPVSAADLTTLLEEYWSGQRAEYPDAGPHLRTTPVVMSDHDPPSNRSPTTPTATTASTEADQ